VGAESSPCDLRIVHGHSVPCWRPKGGVCMAMGCGSRALREEMVLSGVYSSNVVCERRELAACECRGERVRSKE